jgi:hypothetical protein
VPRANLRRAALVALVVSSVCTGVQYSGFGISEAVAIDFSPLIKIFTNATKTINRGAGREINEVRAALKFRAQYRSFGLADDATGQSAHLIRINSHSDDVGQQLGNSGGARVSNHEVYAAIPTDEKEFRGVFGVNPSIAELGQAQAARNLLKTNNIKTTLGEDVDFSRFLAQSPSKLISVIGHNEGGLLRIAEGVSVRLSDMVKACEEAAKLCVFFSCRAQDYFRTFKASNGLGARFDLTFREASQAVVQLDGYIAREGGQGAKLEALLPKIPEFVEGALANAHVEAFVEVSVTATVSPQDRGAMP